MNVACRGKRLSFGVRIMKITRSVVLGLSIMAFAAPLGAQTTLGFEGLTGTYVPQGYGGFSWLGGRGEFSWALGTWGPDNGYPNLLRPSSGTQNAWSNGGTQLDMVFASATLFDFNSAYLSSSYGCSGSDPQTVRGFLAGVQLYQATVTLSCSVMQQFTFNFAGIDQVTFDQDYYNLLVDDIAINGSSVPEPASLVLLATGLVALIPAARRKFNI
jgi:hypothetical protein